MNVEAQDFYERLGVASDATQAEIKTAYVQAVRTHSPERYPEKFRRIREAYETLSDPDSRGEYDATTDPRVNEAITAGQEALTEEDPDSAIKHFKKALVLQPDAHFARNLLGLALGYAEQYQDAKEQFVRLTEEVPDNHVYWHNRGYAERMLDEPKEAEISFRKAIRLDPDDSDAQIGLANALFERNRKREAESVLEDAIRADGVVDFDDISYFFELIKLRVRDQNVEGIAEVTERIQSVLEEDWQKERVAYRYAVLANELSQFLAFDLAEKLARQSRKLVPGDEQIVEFADHVLGNHELMQQWERLQDDDRIRDGFKFFLAVVMKSHFRAWVSEEDKDAQVRQALTVLENVSGMISTGPRGVKMTLADELAHIESEYPRVEELLTNVAKDNIRARSEHASHVALDCPHCGNLGRSEDASGQYTCPQCNQNFHYDSQTGETKKWSAKVHSQGCLKQAGAWIAWIVGLALLSALLGS